MYLRITAKFLFLIAVSTYGQQAIAIEISSKTDAYSESVYLSREQIQQTNTRGRVDLLLQNSIGPYAQIGLQNTTLASGEPDPLNHRYFEGGLSLVSEFHATSNVTWNIQGLFGIRNNYFPDSQMQGTYYAPKKQYRNLVVLSSYREFTTLSWGQPFWEVYSETLQTSVFDSPSENSNTINATFARFGLLKKYRPSNYFTTSFDAWLEPFITADSEKFYYNNYLEMRPTIRLRAIVKSVVAGISFSHLMRKGIPNRTISEDPLANKVAGNRLLFTVGGVF